jgi:tRNA nucleotidyltransferase/poly(A) polymerase
MSVNYKSKYLKYKNKYIELKKQRGGGDNYSWFIKEEVEVVEEEEELLENQYNNGCPVQISYEGNQYSLTHDGNYRNGNKILRREQKITIITENEKSLFEVLKACAEKNKVVLRVAGGWVRDKILGKKNDDIDIAIDIMSGKDFSEKLCEFIPTLGNGWSCSRIGIVAANAEKSKNLETATLKLIKHEGDVQQFVFELDFVNLRSEVYDDDTSRVPETKVATAPEDAERRDLTINAIFYNVNTGKIEDYVGGVRDIQCRIIRTPTADAIKTFKDDPLRILRALRFYARFKFNLDQSIKIAMRDPDIQDRLKIISKDRIGKEIENFFKGDSKPMLAFQEIYDSGLWYIIFGGEEYKNWGDRSILLMKNLDVSMNSQNTMLATLTYPLFELDKSNPLQKKVYRVQNFYLLSIKSSHALLTPSTKIHKCVSDILDIMGIKDQQLWRPSDFAFIIRDVGEYFDNAIEVGKTINPELFNSVQTFAKDNNLVERCNVTPFNGAEVKKKFDIQPRQIKTLVDILFAWQVDNPDGTLDEAFVFKDEFLEKLS